MTSFKINEDSNDLSQPLILPNNSQEETKATDFDLSNTQLPKIPSHSFQNFQNSISNDHESSRLARINSSYDPSTTNLIIKKIPSKPKELPYLVLHPSQDVKNESGPPVQKPPPFVVDQYLGPFIPPEGIQGINVDRLMPYLEFVTTIYEKSFQNMSFKLYQVWLCLWPVLNIGLITDMLIYFKPSWDNKHPMQGSIVSAAIICWLCSIYQAYKMFRIIKKRDKKGADFLITLMIVYLIGESLILVFFCLQDTPADKDEAQLLQDITSTYLGQLLVYFFLVLVPGFWVRKAIVRYQRFIFLKNNLQDPERTGIYYQYVFELLYMISEKGLLYPIKAPKSDEKKEIKKGIVKGLVEGLDEAHKNPE